jgi:hypothetical protein
MTVAPLPSDIAHIIELAIAPVFTLAGIGALAVGNVKYQTQHRLLARMRVAETPQVLGFAEAYTVAREFLAESAAA